MQRVTATEFARGFGKRNQDVQNRIIQVTSHGRTIGYYVSPDEYERLSAGSQPSSPYRSIRETVMARWPDVRRLADDYGATRIRLFGSVARGEDRADSDIDILVAFPRVYDLLKQRVGLELALEDMLGRRIDLVVEAEMNKDLAPHMLADAIEP